MDANVFDQFDGDDEFLEPGPAPGLGDRFRLNFEQAQRGNTVLGAMRDASTPSRVLDRQRFDARYEAFPSWQGWTEGGAALAGQIAGTAASPENFIPIGLGGKILAGSKMAVTGLWAKVFAGAVDGAAVNAVADLAIQGMETGSGISEGFDPVRYGAGILLGGAIGGAGGAAARGMEVRAERRAAGQLFDAARQEGAARQAAGEAVEEALQPGVFDEPVRPVATPEAAAPEALDTPPQASAEILTPQAVEPAPAAGEAAPIEAAPVEAAPIEAATEAGIPAAEPQAIGERLSGQANAAAGEPEFDVDKVVTGRRGGIRYSPRWPAASTLMELGGIDPKGPFAAELRARDITSRTYPGLFRRGGLQRVDNVPRSEVDFMPGGDRDAGFDADVGNERSYVSEDEWIAALEAERDGKPYQSQQQQIDNLDKPTTTAEYTQDLFDEAFALAETSFKANGFDAVPEDMRLKLGAAITEGYYGQEAVDIAAERHFGEYDASYYDDIAELLDEDMDMAEAFGFGRFRDEPQAQQVDDDIPFPEIANDAQSPDAGTARQDSPETAGGSSRRSGEEYRDAAAGNRVSPEPGTAEPGADGKPQTVLQGAEKITGKQLAESRAAQPKTGKQAANTADPVSDFLDMAPNAPMRGERRRDNAGVAGTGERIARIRETADALAEKLQVVATRQGRMTGKAAKLGQYGTRSGVVRVRSLDDFDTLTHEYGHHLQAHVPQVDAFVQRNSAALRQLDYDPAAGRDYEGLAEFFRLWITNRAYLEQNHAALAADFAAVMDGAPEIRDATDAAAKAWSEWLSAPSTAAVRSTVVSGKRDGWLAGTARELRRSGVAGTIADVLQRAYAFAFDDLNPIARSVSHLTRLASEHTGKPLDLKISANPYKLARMSRGAYSAGHMDVMYGVAPYRQTNPASPSLRDAIIEATGKPNALSKWDDNKIAEFGGYLWSRRAIGEWERYRAGTIPNPPDKLTLGDHERNIAEMEAANPQFVSAAAKVHEFARALWTKKYDAGLIDEKTWQEGLVIKDYVPGLRAFDNETDVKTGGKRGGSTKTGLVKRFKGSKRDVINPLESLTADAYETAMAIARNDVVKALDRLALTAGPGGGAIAERIPASQMRLAAMADPLEMVSQAARNAGMSRPDTVLLRDALESAIGDEKQAIFRPAVINEKGEPIVFFRDGGELRALRLADGEFGRQLFGALTTMSRVEQNFWIELVAIPARIQRLGTTTALEFIGANLVRDQMLAWIYYGKPFSRVANTMRGVAQDMLGRDAAKLYNRTGGISGGAETASLSKAMTERDLMALRRKGWVADRLTSFRGLLRIAEVAETGTRLGLFRTFLQEAKARGLDDYEAALEASWRARDYIDFDRRGSGMAQLSRLIPFLNASLQGMDKTARHMLAPLAKRAMGKTLTREDEQALGLAMKSWARLALAVTGGVSLYALMSEHEDHEEISEYTRSTHFMVKAGEKWVAVPKPFEMATAINLGEAVFEAVRKQDPTAFARWRDSLQFTMMPPSLIESNPAVKSWFELRTNTNLFTDAPLVPEHLRGLEPFLQYNANTSELAKDFGAAFNLSPIEAQHVVTNHLGSWGRSLLSLYDMAQPDAPAAAWDDAPITRRFIKDAAKGSTSVTMFWEQVSQSAGELEGKYRSWRAFMEGGDPAGAADYYARLDERQKAYVAVSSMDADARRLHPLVRARGAMQAIGQLRREIAESRIKGADGAEWALSAPERTAADDVLGTLSMAIARNALAEEGFPGWENRQPIDEYGFYRELQAINPALRQRLADGYAAKKVWDWDATRQAWPELRRRALEDGSEALTADLVAGVRGAGLALPEGIALPRGERPRLTME